MAYVNPEQFEGKNHSLVYVAGKTSEAKKVEKLLSENSVTYTLHEVPFLRQTLFGGQVELPGVGFIVLQSQAQFCRELLETKRFYQGLVFEDEE